MKSRPHPSRLLAMLWLWLVAVSAAAAPLFESTLSSRRFTTHDGLPQMQTERLFQDSRGYIYMGTLSGFVRYDGETLTPFLRTGRINIVGFAEVGDSVRALGFRRQWTVDDDQVSMQPLDPAWQWLLNNFNAMDLPNGYVLLEDKQEEQRRLCLLTTHGWRQLCRTPLLDQMTPDRKVYVDADTIYIPTRAGLYRVCGSKAVRLTAKADVYSLCRNSQGLWVFAHDAVYRLEGRRLLRYAAMPADLAPDYGLLVRSIATPGSSTDSRFVVADGHSFYMVADGKVQRLATGFNLIRDMLCDRWGRLWLATYEGVYCFFQRSFTNHRLYDDNDVPRSLAVTPSGQLLVGTLNGKLLALLPNGAETDSLLSNEPDNFYAPSSAVVGGSVFMAGRDGVTCIDGSLRQHRLGLPADRYQFVGADTAGRLLFGTRRAVMAYHPATARTDTLIRDIVHPWCATTDTGGRLWVGSTAGLFTLQPHPQADTAPQQASEYGRLTVTAMERNPLSGNVILASCDSLFATTTVGGVRCLSQQMPLLSGHEVRSLHVSPRGFLVVAVIDGLFVCTIDAHDRLGPAAFFNHQNGFTLIEPQKAVMAEEADGTVWLAGVEQMTSFRPAELLASSQADTRVSPPLRWWQHWWVAVLAVLLALGVLTAVIALVLLRHNRLAMQRLQREKRQKDLQIQTIRLKAIPHFHSNVLAGIEYFLMTGKTEESSHYLKLYSDFANQTLTDIDLPARTVGQEIDYARMYLELEQLRYGERLTYDFKVESDVDQQALLPTMLIYTYCQNAVKHGISSKPEGGHISIVIGRSGTATVVRVTDNGVGRARAATLNNGNSTKKGLKILHEQIELYNQSNRQPIRQNVIDLTDEQHRPAGTCYEMVIPADYQYA